jgi:23S rRNA pseudouridine1911/1915/1917 synthase
LTGTMRCWTVPPSAAKARLDRYLASEIPDQSRSQIQQWIRSGQVKVNGEEEKSGYLLHTGDQISIAAAPPCASAVPAAEDIPIGIIYEDPWIAVVDKPAGMACHVGAGIRSGTLVNALLHRLGPLETGDPSRPGIVHRIDKPTSGLLVVARDTASHRALARQFKEREVHKEYLALVYGTPSPVSGTVDKPIGRDPVDRKKISTRARHSRSAITHYEVLESFDALSLLRIRIETGRTHQIRVHMASLGHAVAGDSVYGIGRERNLPLPTRTMLQRLGRVFLHAHRLAFHHPRTGERLSFVTPLPAELEEVLRQLRTGTVP